MIKLTPEVTSAHSNLKRLCETFEECIDKLCASSSLSLRQREFYDCIQIAGKCADALSHFQAVRFHEDAEFENKVAAVNRVFVQTEHELTTNSIRRIESVKSEVGEYSLVAEYLGVDISTVTGIDPKKFLQEDTENTLPNVPYQEALTDLNRLYGKGKRSELPVFYVSNSIHLTDLFICLATVFFSAIAYSWITYASSFIEALVSGVLFTPFVMWPYMIVVNYFRKRKNTRKAIDSLGFAALGECHVARMEMRDGITNASTEHGKKVEAVRSNRDNAMAYIEQEFRSFDTRLCQRLDRLQTVVDSWVTANARIMSILDDSTGVAEISVGEIKGAVGRQFGTRLMTRLGTASIDLGGRDWGTHHTEELARGREDKLAEQYHKAEQGDAKAQNELGLMYENGDRVTQDYAEAVKWYHRAAEQGNAEGQFKLGWMYQNGWGVTQDDAEAVKWYRKAAEQGNDWGQNNLGGMYQNGRGVTQDDAEAVKWYRRAAEQGNDWGQNNLGWMYQNGRGVTQDDAEAVKWHRRAAEQGNDWGQNNLGWMYQNGRGVTQDDAEAVKWYRKAAEQGNDWGQNNLGWMYQNGQGVTQDDAEAVKWYRKAAEQGNTEGQFKLGWMYQNGQGVTQDDAEAVKWYRKAAEQGNDWGQNNLGGMYQNGRGVTQDDAEAVKWYRKAAEQGNALGQNNLGWMYQNGRGVTQDDAEAVKWYRKAAEQGNADAKHALEDDWDDDLEDEWDDDC